MREKLIRPNETLEDPWSWQSLKLVVTPDAILEHANLVSS